MSKTIGYILPKPTPAPQEKPPRRKPPAKKADAEQEKAHD